MSQAIKDPIGDLVNEEQGPGLSRQTLFRKSLIIVAASAVLGVAAIAPNAAFAFLPPPPPGPPPGLAGPPPGLGGLPHPGPGLGGPPHLGPGGPADLSRFASPPGFRDGAHGALGSNFPGRAAAANYARSGANSYGRSGSYGYGHSGWRNRSYGVYVDGSSNGSSYGYSDDSCYYTYSRGRRVTVCSGY